MKQKSTFPPSPSHPSLFCNLVDNNEYIHWEKENKRTKKSKKKSNDEKKRKEKGEKRDKRTKEKRRNLPSYHAVSYQ